MSKALTFAKWGGGTMAGLVVGLWGVIEVKSSATFEDTPIPEIQASTDPAVIEHGKYLFHNVAHCSTCHLPFDDVKAGAIGPGKAPPAKGGGVWDMPFGVLRSPNITPDPETGIADYTDGEIARVMTTGVRKDGTLSVFMSLALGQMAHDDTVAIISYLRSMEPVRNEVPESEPNLLGRAFVSFVVSPASRAIAPDTAPSEPGVERGKYLAEGPALCRGCHTRVDPGEGFAEVGTPFAGSDPEPDPTDPSFVITAPNLTPGGLLRNLNEDAFVARLKAGRMFAGSKMPWEAFSGMKEEDLRSIHQYLMTLPASDVDVGQTRRPAE